MTVELALCVAMMLVALPVSRSIGAHYAGFVLVNLAFVGVQEADATVLVLLFAMLAILDVSLVLAGGRTVLLISAATSFALALESTINQDWLLSHVTYLSAVVNSVIAACLAKEYWAWMRGRFSL